MRKINISWLILLLCLNNVFSQNFSRRSIENKVVLDKFSVIDSAFLKCTYQLNYVCDSNYMDRKSDDLQILLIGKNISKFYSKYRWDYNLYASESIKKEKDYYHIKKDAWSFEVFKNYPTGKITVTDIVSMLQTSHVYEEEMPVFNWKIENEQQTVLNYICQKATVHFRGRDFVAWFTQEIPISNGPWKFGGLPGLILKLYDTRNQFVYECTGIEMLKNSEPIKFYKVNYQKITREGLDKLFQKNHNDFIAYSYFLTGQEINMYNPQTKHYEPKTSGARKQAYNPIELE
ncbi:MAG: GLPGLI family protein [Prevotellaceae bacterium]|jgi:GLPGLI family protein|nr:GLPGLI family protein [Prevotellaceae bacterium]